MWRDIYVDRYLERQKDREIERKKIEKQGSMK